jgi:1,4-dihydroxy-2-naphthoyl-CoA hydrolase
VSAIRRSYCRLMTSTDPSPPNLLQPPLGPLAVAMGMHLVESSAERVVITMPVEGNTQPYGLLHGGANAVLVETAGSIGAAAHAGPGRMVVGLDISCTHHRAAREGIVTAVAEPLSLGRSVTCYEVRISDEDGRPLCTGRLTCLIRDVPGS